MTSPAARPIGVLDVLAFLAEVALLAAIAVAGSRLGTGWVSVGLAVLLPAATAVLWGVLLAPRASHRMPYPVRLFVKLGLVVVAGAVLAAEQAWWAVALAALAGAVMASAEIRGSRAGSPT